MKIVECEKIFLSENEANTWTKFYEILEGLEEGCKNPNRLNLINKIQNLLNDLWEEVEDVE
jgi:hypothetical protein